MSFAHSMSDKNKSMRSMISQSTTQQIFTDVGYYRGVMVALKHIEKEHIQLSRTVLMEFSDVCVV